MLSGIGTVNVREIEKAPDASRFSSLSDLVKDRYIKDFDVLYDFSEGGHKGGVRATWSENADVRWLSLVALFKSIEDIRSHRISCLYWLTHFE